jgi:tetratricopeptide (TPR) repeat protein
LFYPRLSEKVPFFNGLLGDLRGIGIALGNLGTAHSKLGDVYNGIKFFEKALVIDRDLGDRFGESADLGNLGTVYLRLDKARIAIDFYEKQLVIDRETGDQSGEGKALFNSALAFDKLGDHAKAIFRAEVALKIFETIEDPNAAKVRAQLAEWREAKP